ncbi:glycosyltransferase family 2 protein [Thermodesulfovibrio sp.]|uniref:glycosyltransferase family 2 protein n=1 Tax=Thermodesulfovibrio sp. TaxID=2067987 RepID=UPI0030A746F8
MKDRNLQGKLITIDKPIIINHPEDKFETLLFLPPSEGRKGEGGLRTKVYFKHNYKLNPEDNLWYICDTAGNLVKPAPEEIQREILAFLTSVQHSEPESGFQKPITELPLITVITVVLNGEKYLEQTIQSVINQTYPNVEYIIIDGGSTDGTLDIIKKYEDHIDYWVSEKDKGIYDAMNKGVEVASGEWINFMNSGDVFYRDDVLEKIYQMQGFNKTNDVIYGDVCIDFGNYNVPKKAKFEKIEYFMPFQHQSTFVKTSIFKFSKFNDKFKLAADHEFFLRLYKWGKSFLYTKTIISKVSPYGLSDINRILCRKEYHIIQKMHNVSGWQRTTYYYYTLSLEVLKMAIKKFMPHFMINYIRKVKEFIG